MIASLTGTVAFRGPTWIAVEVAGVGYKVTCPSRVLAEHPTGSDARLLIHTQVSEKDITLYGFAAPGEMDAFHALTSLQGVGPSMAMALLGVMTAPELGDAVRDGDKVALCRADRVGRRIADRIVLELSGHAAFAAVAGATPGRAADLREVEERAIAALMGLDYKKTEAVTAVRTVLDSLKDSPTPPGVEDLVARALKLRHKR